MIFSVLFIILAKILQYESICLFNSYQVRDECAV